MARHPFATISEREASAFPDASRGAYASVTAAGAEGRPGLRRQSPPAPSTYVTAYNVGLTAKLKSLFTGGHHGDTVLTGFGVDDFTL